MIYFISHGYVIGFARIEFPIRQSGKAISER